MSDLCEVLSPDEMYFPVNRAGLPSGEYKGELQLFNNEPFVLTKSFTNLTPPDERSLLSLIIYSTFKINMFTSTQLHSCFIN